MILFLRHRTRWHLFETAQLKYHTNLQDPNEIFCQIVALSTLNNEAKYEISLADGMLGKINSNVPTPLDLMYIVSDLT